MIATAERLEFAPPPNPGLLRALLLALLAHGVLMAALTWGVRWKHDTQSASFEAELWAQMPQEAAPPPPPQRIEPEPVLKPTPAPETPAVQAQIALEREKKRQLEQQREQQVRLEQQRQAERAKAEKAKLAQQKKREEQQARQLELQRQKNLQRMTGLAGASGDATSSGTALKSAGPSPGYAGRIRARIKPNIVFTEDALGNPTAEVQVRTAPDGTIVGRKITQPSGNPAWDEAVLKAIDKTAILPRDGDGRVPPVLDISFRLRD